MTTKEDFLKRGPEEIEIEQKMLKMISAMPASVQPRFKVLHMLSDERSRINDEYEKEVKALEAKYREKKRPMLERRNEIVLGKVDNYDEYLPIYEKNYQLAGEIVAGIQKTEKEKAEDLEEAASHKPTDVSELKFKKGIPDFWKTAICNNQMMMQYIRENDRDTLKYLTDVWADEGDDWIKIELTFAENEWFTNEKLSLKVRCRNGQKDDDVEETEGTPIDWREGKNLTVKKIKKKQKNKKTGESRTIMKTVPAESFFNVFESRKAPEKEDSDNSLDEDDQRLLDQLDESLQAAQDFKDMYGWEALEYYLNFNFGMGDQDFLGMMGQGGSDSDEDGDDDAPKKKAPKKDKPDSAASGDKPAEEGKQECK